MDWDFLKFALDTEYWVRFFGQFSFFAPLIGVILAMTEAFLPILPLSVIVAINIMALGFWQGYVVSWIGTTVGTYIVFTLVRKFGMKKFQHLMQRSRRVRNIFIWIQRQGFLPIFILMTFPFTPSIVVCGLSALAGIKSKTFLYSLIFGKLFMVFSLSLIGYNLSSFIQQPIKSMMFILLILLFSGVGKIVVGMHEKKLDRLHQQSNNSDIAFDLAS